MTRNPAPAALAAAMLFTWLPQAQAQSSVEAFYKGKDVQILIGAGVGGTYGLYAQLAAQHLRKYIPGQPNLIMQSMPGAGGNVALNYSYNVAPKDGTLIHLVHAEVLFETLLTKGVKFNAGDYQYIGRLADADAIALATKASGVRTIEDAKKREVTMGATGAANVFALGPLMMNRVAGTRFRIIGGYKGTSDIHLAMERGELDGAGMTTANALTIHGDKLKSGDLVPFFAIAARRLPEYPDLPAMTEFGNASEKTLMEIYASAGTIGRALAFPPGVPAERVEALRTAFSKMLDDPDFKAEVRKSNIPIAPMSGKELSAYVATVLKTPADQIEQARTLHAELLPAK
ncbi:MAG TPA: tripartite tricarboxylate transporter substrate-binding protein [Hyphomicrobiaceae bacterium]|nr:tripartite tricarboxylate transporter substrate-binding protein [Hyphomicrobiaceae bacterium]